MIRRLLWWLLGRVPSGYQPDGNPAAAMPQAAARSAHDHVMTPIRVQVSTLLNPSNGQWFPSTVVLSRCSCGGLTTGILTGVWTLEDLHDQPASEVAQQLLDASKEKP